MTDIFISYKRRLRPQVERLVEALRALKLNVWYDARLESGLSFSAEISQEVRTAHCVMVCWSDDVFAHGGDLNGWVLGEATIGRERGALVSVQLEPTSFDPPWNILHHESLIGWVRPDGLGPEDARDWLAVLDVIGKKVGRPGLAEYPVANCAGTAESLMRWAQTYADDPLAEDAWTRIEQLEAEALKKRLAAERAARATLASQASRPRYDPPTPVPAPPPVQPPTPVQTHVPAPATTLPPAAAPAPVRKKPSDAKWIFAGIAVVALLMIAAIASEVNKEDTPTYPSDTSALARDLGTMSVLEGGSPPPAPAPDPGPPPAPPEDIVNRVVCIKNSTTQTLHLAYRWSTADSYKDYSIPAGERHFFPGSTDTMGVRFDFRGTEGFQPKEYVLPTVPLTKECSGSKGFEMKWDSDSLMMYRLP